jgi:hypothetical protein
MSLISSCLLFIKVSVFVVAPCFHRIPGFITSEGGTDDQFHMDLQRWWCSHIQHVSAFVKQHPSHKLIELDLYDKTGLAATMVSLFQPGNLVGATRTKKEANRESKSRQ